MYHKPYLQARKPVARDIVGRSPASPRTFGLDVEIPQNSDPIRLECS